MIGREFNVDHSTTKILGRIMPFDAGSMTEEEVKAKKLKAYRTAYYQKNKEKLINDAKEWVSKNREKHRENQRKLYIKNKEKRIKNAKEWISKNRERYRETQRKLYVKTNKNLKNRAWREKNREHSNEYYRNYYHKVLKLNAQSYSKKLMSRKILQRKKRVIQLEKKSKHNISLILINLFNQKIYGK
jgi:hypothetical protein